MPSYRNVATIVLPRIGFPLSECSTTERCLEVFPGPRLNPYLDLIRALDCPMRQVD